MGVEKIGDAKDRFQIDAGCLIGWGHVGIVFEVTLTDGQFNIDGVIPESQDLLSHFNESVVYRRAQAALDEFGIALVNDVPYIRDRTDEVHPLLKRHRENIDKQTGSEILNFPKKRSGYG